MARRRMMGIKDSGESLLPAEYQQVEWIGTNLGNPYINTNIRDRRPIKFETDIAFLSVQSARNRQLTGTSGAYWGINASRYFECYTASTLQAELERFYHVEYQNNNIAGYANARKLFVDGNEILSLNGANSVNDYFWLFRISNGFGMTAQMKRVTLTGSSGVLFDGIPCYRKSDGEIGMYDLVSEAFIEKTGSGTFTKGADV